MNCSYTDVAKMIDHSLLQPNLTAADLFARGPAASALATAEQALPVLDPIPVVDAHPLAHAPRLDAVPTALPAGSPDGGSTAPAGLLFLTIGVGVFALGRRPLGARP